jgi:hypothetical protein
VLDRSSSHGEYGATNRDWMTAVRLMHPDPGLRER